jgi:SAM-dependent methyltransferase
MAKPLLRQGLHPDPASPMCPPPARGDWKPIQKEAFFSREMELFRDCLRLPGQHDIRAAILDDLSTFYHLSAAECIWRCTHWEELSTQEWHAKPRNSATAIADFYHTTTSWSFDLLWYAYLQAQGYRFPVQACIARAIEQPGDAVEHGAVARTTVPGEDSHRHLDFGSGIGVTSQLFAALGYRSDLADISTTLLDFARYRLERRGQRVGYIDLNMRDLPDATYDVITAMDTLAHVVDLPTISASLHRALVPGGLLFTNFDVRPRTPENAWHLYDNDLPLRFILRRAGFEPIRDVGGGMIAYRAVSATGIQHALRGARDLLLLRSPLRPAARRVRELVRMMR